MNEDKQGTKPCHITRKRLGFQGCWWQRGVRRPLAGAVAKGLRDPSALKLQKKKKKKSSDRLGSPSFGCVIRISEVWEVIFMKTFQGNLVVSL